MISLFRGSYSCILSRTRFFSSKSVCFTPLWKPSGQRLNVKTVNLELLLTRFQSRCYSSKVYSGVSSRKPKLNRKKPVMKDDKEAFFVVRKGDVIGVFKSLSDCQSQVGTSISEPPVSVFKGYSLPSNTDKYLRSYGLKNALYSIGESDFNEAYFGKLVPFDPSSYRGETSSEPVTKKRQQEAIWPDYGDSVGSMLSPNAILPKHLKLEPHRVVDQSPSFCRSCTLEFDGASKGNPGQAGAGVVLRSDDGSMTCRLREGLGVATNNFAEYRGFILGLKYALNKGFTSVRVRGDSKLVCMQIQGLWKVKNQNISGLYDEAKKLKDRFQSFQIIHILRDLNSEADVQANLGVELADGQVEEVIDK